jgi:hypothetical protein
MAQDYIGAVFGRLTVTAEAPAKVFPSGGRMRMWFCRCDCGATSVVHGCALRSGHTQSCGCLNRERITTHGQLRDGRVSPEYRVWRDMLQRCYNPRIKNFNRYGGRGISVCQEWRDSFEAFFVDVGPRPTPGHSIDRIDVNGHYCLGNCRWATTAQQARNRTSNHWVTYKGQRMTLTDAAKSAGMHRNTLRWRIEAGWGEDRLFEPLVR